ncbi:hypothetical protein X766_06545 [Mesorhizobium sp. LSJC255A00]|nr:hypothetical protein X766_06545 [Mesorhizobium sp. LSJC255A00]
MHLAVASIGTIADQANLAFDFQGATSEARIELTAQFYLHTAAHCVAIIQLLSCFCINHWPKGRVGNSGVHQRLQQICRIAIATATGIVSIVCYD